MAGELAKNIGTLRNLELVYETGDYTGAFILYFKALLAVCDYGLLKAGYGVPKDHSERFHALEKRFPDVYAQLDYLFRFYRQTYSTTVKKSVCDEAAKSVEVYSKKFKVPENH